MPHGSPTGRRGRPNKWKMTEAARFMRAARAAGVDVARFELDPKSGKMGLVVARDESPEDDDKANPWGKS